MKARLYGEYVEKIGFFMNASCFFGTVISVLRTDGVVEGGTGIKMKKNNLDSGCSGGSMAEETVTNEDMVN